MYAGFGPGVRTPSEPEVTPTTEAACEAAGLDEAATNRVIEAVDDRSEPERINAAVAVEVAKLPPEDDPE